MTAATHRVIKIQSGLPIVPLVSAGNRGVLSEDLVSLPVTRVEWDVLASQGRDPFEWFDRLPAGQRVLPMGVAKQGGGVRFRVSSNVTVVR